MMARAVSTAKVKVPKYRNTSTMSPAVSVLPPSMKIVLFSSEAFDFRALDAKATWQMIAKTIAAKVK